MKRLTIKSAANQQTEDTRFKDLADVVDDDYDYLINGLDKLQRSGNMDIALDILHRFSDDVNSYIEEVADNIDGGEQ